MSSHSDKYLTKLLLGLGAVIASIFTLIFACFERVKADDWYGWGLVASVLMCAGLMLLMQAFVHKIKADFSRRQKVRQQQKSPGEE